MRGIGRLEGCDETAAASTHRIRTQLPDQRTLHWPFYGSGHLHQINIEVDGRHELISDIERDALHREVGRSQGQLASQYEHDPQGRLLKHRALRMGNAQQVALERSYQYDASGNLTQRQDSLRGEQRFRYDPTGRILQATGKVEEYFAFDPAGNLLAQRSGPQPAIGGNRLKVWQELRFEYDVHGNVVQRRKGAHEEAQLRWNAEHQLQEAEVIRTDATTLCLITASTCLTVKAAGAIPARKRSPMQRGWSFAWAVQPRAPGRMAVTSRRVTSSASWETGLGPWPSTGRSMP
ncbi:RHS repeat domain-containing protein [Pelomonas sp. BJYL3]|uniref:RHS repeat domain-containing protein n=1 Tax=Pelomonas sp. BJYL3 TaxID=2976697 RepID=UPI0022B39C7C|nr:RHS repeat domain-containing protein [Pelomonas sp. BJYL3]